MRRTFSSIICLAVLLSACGGGGGGGGGGSSGPITGTPSPTPTPTPTGGCSLSARESWAAGVLNEWYLFPNLLATGVNPSSFSTVEDYIDALTAPARAQGKDRHFTFLTSIAQENAFFGSGESAGFGIRLSVDTAARRLFVTEAFEGAPALAAGIDRGTEILAIGTTQANLRLVSDILAAEGPDGITNALGPTTAGTVRWLRVSTNGTVSELSVTKATFTMDPVSPRYGVKVLSDGGQNVGYVNLRTFINPADPQLRTAFNTLRGQGINKVIVDLRYNGGGLVSVAEVMANLLGGNRLASDVIDSMTFRPEKASSNTTTRFAPQPQSISPVKIAFIGTGGTASASELVINAFLPYLGASVALVGSNTFGKPVGQIAQDLTACDDRLRVMAFKVENADRQGDYFNGLAPFMQSTCQAADDIARPLGDPAEASTKAALDFIAGRTCSPISGGITTQALRERRELLQPARPSAAQHEVPGLF